MPSIKDISSTEYIEANAVDADPADYAPGPNEVGGSGYEDEDTAPRTIVKEAVAAEDEVVDAEVSAEDAAAEAERKRRFKDHDAAEAAYAEAQAYAQREASRADLFAKRLEELEQQQAIQRQAIPQAQSDPVSQVVALADSDPYQAFQVAMSQVPQAVPAVIATVQSDATMYAQQAAQARAEGDDTTAASFEQQSRSATMFAEEMRATHMQAQQQRIVAPQQARNFEADLMAATAAVYQEDPTSAAFAGQIAQILESDPRLLGDGSQQALAQGVRTAYKQAYGDWAQTPEGQSVIAEHYRVQGQSAAELADRPSGASSA
jgi:hypothetical protein